MSIKVYTLWNLLPKSLNYNEFEKEEAQLDQYTQGMISKLNNLQYFVLKSDYRGEAYLDESFEQFYLDNVRNSDYLIILVRSNQIVLLERYIYARWFIFSMKFQNIRDKVILVVLGNERQLKQNWNLICHRVFYVEGNETIGWIDNFDWIDHIFVIKDSPNNDEVASTYIDVSESTQLSNQITEIHLTNEIEDNENENKTIDKNFVNSSNNLDRLSEDYESHLDISNFTKRKSPLKRHQSCPNFMSDMCLNFDRLEKKHSKGKFSKRFFCSIFFSLNNINDGSLYADKLDRDLIFDREYVSQKKPTVKKIFSNLFTNRNHKKSQEISQLEDNEISCEITDMSSNKYNIVEKGDDYILKHVSYQTTFNDKDDSLMVDSLQVVSLPLELPPYTEPTDPNSNAYSYVKELRESKHIEEIHSDLSNDNIQIHQTPIHSIGVHSTENFGFIGSNSFPGDNNELDRIIIYESHNQSFPFSNTQESINNGENLDPITEITENCQPDNSDNTSKMAGDITTSGSSTMSTSATNNPWGSVESYPEVLIKKSECEVKSGIDSGLCFESPSSGVLNCSEEKEKIPTPIFSTLTPAFKLTNLSNQSEGISFSREGLISGAMSPNIMTRKVLLTGSSCESDQLGTSRVRKRNKERSKQPERKRSISPVYRNDEFRLSRRYQHQSRIDLPIRRRTTSTHNYNDYYQMGTFPDERQRYNSNVGYSYTQRQSRDPSLVFAVDEDEISIGEIPSREPSSDRNGNVIKSTQLPDGGWLTGVFSWFGGSRAPTPIIGRREVFQEASTSRDVPTDLGSESEINENKLFPTSASLNDFKNESKTRDLSESGETSRRQRIPSMSRSDYAGYTNANRMIQTDFVISLINPSIRQLPRHVYWFYTSMAPSQQRLSQMMTEYRSNIPRVYDKVKNVISDNRTKIACIFIGTALFVPTAHHLLPATTENTADKALSFRFGNMINLLRPSLMWTGSTVISKFRPGLYKMKPSQK